MYPRQVTTSYCCERLPWILTTSYMSKTEAINWRLIFKYRVHIRSGKIHLMRYQVTTEYCCDWLLCMYGVLLQATNVKGTLTIRGIPKTEATNWRLVSICTAHIRSGKFLKLKTRLLQVTVYSRLVTTMFCSKRLQCIQVVYQSQNLMAGFYMYCTYKVGKTHFNG